MSFSLLTLQKENNGTLRQNITSWSNPYIRVRKGLEGARGRVAVSSGGAGFLDEGPTD